MFSLNNKAVFTWMQQTDDFSDGRTNAYDVGKGYFNSTVNLHLIRGPWAGIFLSALVARDKLSKQAVPLKFITTP